MVSWLSELKKKKKKKKKTFKGQDKEMNQITSEKYLNFFSLMAFWKFQHFILVSKISQKLFKPLPCYKFQYLTVLEKCCMPSAYLPSTVAFSLRWTSCGLWASCFLCLTSHVSTSLSAICTSVFMLVFIPWPIGSRDSNRPCVCLSIHL